MQLLMLSGNSLSNRDWIYRVQSKVGHIFEQTLIRDYKHWVTGAEWIDLDYELKQLQQDSNKLQASYGIFAKSIGTVLALKAVKSGIVRPSFLLFCGIPLDYIIANNLQFASELKSLATPVTLIHNEHDTVGSAENLKKYLGTLTPNIEVIITPRDSHDYEGYELLARKLTALKEHTF